MKTSAGIVVYRVGESIELLAGHPGGPFWAKRHEGAWSIIKGEIEDGEDPEQAARREFEEETGVPGPEVLWPVGSITQKAGKVVIGFAGELDVDAESLRSNIIAIEWPPRSGRSIEIPEIDRFGWFDVAEARGLLNAAQLPFVDRLEQMLAN